MSSGGGHHSRGLDRFDQVLRSAGLEALSDLLASRVKSATRVRVLEIGCGEGRLLLDLHDRFGPPLELHGINDPGWSVALDPRHHNLKAKPVIHSADAQDLRSLNAPSFDVIVSQVVVPHIRLKDRVLEESARLLSVGGLFLHDIDHRDPVAVEEGGPDLPRWTILRGGVRISSIEYLKCCGVEVACGRSTEHENMIAMYRRKRGHRLQLGLLNDARRTVVLKTLPARLDGRRRWGVRTVSRQP